MSISTNTMLDSYSYLFKYTLINMLDEAYTYQKNLTATHPAISALASIYKNSWANIEITYDAPIQITGGGCSNII